MTAGLEVYTLDGHLQLDAENLYFKLEDFVVLDNTGWSQHGTNGSYRDVTFYSVTSSDAAMLALASQAGVWHRQTSSTSTSVTFRVYRTTLGNYSVNCWLFSNKPPANALPPFAIFNASGACILSSAYPPARPMGTFKAGVYEGLSRTGRTLAFVPQTRLTSRYTTYTSGGYGTCQVGSTVGYQQYSQTGWNEEAMTCWGEDLTMSNLYSQVGPFPYQCSVSPNVPPGNTSGTLGKSSALILDVTGY